MKKSYRMAGDIFIACAFVSFIVGGVFKVFAAMGINTSLVVVGWEGLLKLCAITLLFSIALSLLDIAHDESEQGE